MENSWNLIHLGMPVKDLDKAMADFNKLGAASFKEEFLIDSSNFEEYLVYGKTPDPVVKTRGIFCQMGPVWLELLQPVQGHTVHKEFLESKGEGIGHIAYQVEDLDAETAKLVEQGFPVVLSFTRKGETERAGVYIDTRNSFSGLITEFVKA